MKRLFTASLIWEQLHGGIEAESKSDFYEHVKFHKFSYMQID